MLTSSDKNYLKKNFVTKEDLKKELKKYATKEDLSWQVSNLRDEICDITDDLKNEFITRLDVVMGELRSMREEHSAMFFRQRENTDQI